MDDLVSPQALETRVLDGLLDDLVRGVEIELSPVRLVSLLAEPLNGEAVLLSDRHRLLA